jgi:hypothetical protein
MLLNVLPENAKVRIFFMIVAFFSKKIMYLCRRKNIKYYVWTFRPRDMDCISFDFFVPRVCAVVRYLTLE